MRTPKCKVCGAEIISPLSEVMAGADWLCLECSGATLSDFFDEEEMNMQLIANRRTEKGSEDKCRKLLK